MLTKKNAIISVYILSGQTAKTMDLKGGMDYLVQNQAQLLALTIRLAEINSGSFNLRGIQQVADVLKTEFAALGCEQTIMPVAPMTDINLKGEKEEIPLGPVLRCWKRPEAPFQVLFVGHMDTVYGPDHRFQQPRLVTPEILNGPGVADMKGGLVILLWALKAFEQLPQAAKLGWEVILNSDEEIGSFGSAEIIEHRAKKHNVGFVFEPAMDEHGTLAGVRKGSGKITLVMRGKAAHAGRHFADGRNAIVKMAEIIQEVNGLNGQREGVTINAGFIQGGEAVNVVPDCCVCRLDIRVPNNNDADWVKNSLNAIMLRVNSQPDYKLEVHGDFDRKPKVFTPEMEQLYAIVQKVGANIGLNISWQPSGGCCDGNNLAAMGLPNVDTLGVRGGKIHSVDEYLVVASLVERAQLLMNILAHLSDNGFA